MLRLGEGAGDAMTNPTLDTEDRSLQKKKASVILGWSGMGVPRSE